ncbi:MAG: FHA domain-containing protein [bacterium]
MSGPTSYRLSQETYELLKENRDFYQSLRELQEKKESPLLPKATDAESRTERKVRDNGEVEVSIILPLDDNANPADGRLYVRDTFVFDPSEQVLKSYQRSFEASTDAGDQWKGWLGKYQGLAAGEKRSIKDPAVQKFALRVARSHGRAITDEDGNTLPAIKEAFKKESRLLGSANQQILELKNGLQLKIKDKLNFYNLAWRDGKIEVSLQLTVDDDAEVGNGRILLRDKFTLDAKTLEFRGVERRWSLAPGAEADPSFTAALKALQAKPDPSAEEAEAFIKNLLPALLPKGEPDLASALSLMGGAPELPAGYRSRFAASRSVNKEALKTGAQFSLEAMYVVAQEQAMKRFDESQGWAYFGEKVDQAADKAAIDGLFQKAKALSEKNPGTNPFALLGQLDLGEGEKRLRDRLLGDSLMAELDSLAKEPDAELRGKALSLLARDRMLIAGGLGQSALFLAEELKKSPATQRAAEDILAIVQGKGNFGQKAGYVLPLFSQEVAKPSMLLGMAAAPFLGTAFELGGLKLAKYAWDAKKISDVGRGARLGAAVLGMSGEALAFTTIHRGFERLHHSSETAWKGMGGELVSSVLLFGGMRLTHDASGWATARMAEGKWGSRFGLRFGESEFAGGIGMTPRGRLLLGEFAPAAGKGIPTLTTTGKLASGAMNHLGGILTMQASGALSRKLGLSPDNGQSFGANFFDATVMYTQAMVGSQVANYLSGGRLNEGIGKFKMGVENLKQGIPGSAPLPPPADPKKSDPPAAPGEPAKGPEGKASAPAPSPVAPAEAKAPAAKVEPAAPKPRLLDRLIGEGEGGWRAKLQAAREWLADLSPAKVRALQGELEALKKKQAETEEQVGQKSSAVKSLEGELAKIRAEQEAAKQEIADKTKELAETKTKLSETEAARDAAKRDLEEKTTSLQAAEQGLKDLEAKKAEAEQRLQDYVEQAELSELDLGVGSLDQQIAAHKAELGKLRAEKQKAEIKAGALEQQAEGLRAELEKANHELKRRELVDLALTETEGHVSRLQKEVKEYKASLDDLRTQIGELQTKHEGANQLTADQARKIAELEGRAAKLEKDLQAKTEEFLKTRERLGARERELAETQTKLDDTEAELRTARFNVESTQKSITYLEKVQEALKRDKTELEGKLAGAEGDKSALETKLAETEEKLKQTARDLKKAEHDLRIADSAKRNLTAEGDRLRGRVQELGEEKREAETRLGESIRGLDALVKEKDQALAKASSEAEFLADSLRKEGERAQAAEAREADLIQQREALQAQHDKTLGELAAAQRRLESLGKEVEGRKREIERQRGVIKDLNDKIAGLRTKKTDLERELREARVANAGLEKQLETTRAELAAERAKEPEVVRDLTTEMELEARIEALETEKAQRDGKLAGLEVAKAELERRQAELLQAKAETEKQLRSTEADLDLAKGAAEGLAKDLKEVQQRAQAEEARLKAGLEGWRKRFEETEAARALLETKARGLDDDLSKAKERIQGLERDLAGKVSELEKSRGENKVLVDDVAKLENELGELRGSLSAKEAELARVKAELGEKIGGLEKDKASLESELQQKVDTIVKVRNDIETEQKRASALDKELREAKGLAEQTRVTLEGEKRGLERSLEAKQAELRRREGELEVSRARVEELEQDIAKAKRELSEAEQVAAQQKTTLEEKIAAGEAELGGLREELGKSQDEAKRLGRELEGVRAELAAERAALKKLRGEFEELKVRSAAESQRLQREAEELRAKEREVSAAAQAKAAQVETLEGGLAELKRQKEAAEAELGGKLKVADQATQREAARADQAAAELEALKAKVAVEAEGLRREASESKAAAAVAEAKAKEAEQKLAAEQARLESLSAELAAAQARVEALEAPASKSFEAEEKAKQAGYRATRLQEQLTAAEQRATAAQERVKALEGDLAALRAATEAEAETLRTQASAHAERATAAEERAKASGLRIVALEAELNAERVKSAALSSDAEGKGEALATVSNLNKEIEGLKKMILEAEQRAADAERRAGELDVQLAESGENLERMGREVESLRAEKVRVDSELKAAREKLARLEPQLTEAVQKRKAAETELLGHKSRVAELEQQAQSKDGEITKKTEELKTARAEVSKMWGESQEAGRKAQARMAELEQELATLRNLSEGYQEQIAIEQRNVADTQKTLELMQLGEEQLRAEIEALKVERNAANARAERLELTIAERDSQINLQQISLENEQPLGFRFPFLRFTQEDPRTQAVEPRVQGTVLIGNAQNEVVGEAHILAGGAQGSMRLAFADSSRLVGKTTIGNGKRKHQEDAIYMARFVLPNGLEVKVMAWGDGMGGMGDPGSGAVAAGGFLQGMHAALAEIVREGRVPTPEELYAAGNQALQFQRSRADLNPPLKGPKGAATASATGGIVVIVGNEAMLVTAGDASVSHDRPDAEGNYQVIGYSNVDAAPVPDGNGGYSFNNVTKGFHEPMGRLYRISNLQPGDRLLIGSDGLWENLVGPGYKMHGSQEARFAYQAKPPTQALFRPMLQALKATRGRWDAAELIHDQLALPNIKSPGKRVQFLGEEIQLPAHADPDNILVLDYEHGQAPGVKVEVPLNYSPLEPVPTPEQLRAAEAAAAQSTAKGFKVPPPPPSTDPQKVSRPSDPQRVAANFYVKYFESLTALFGKNADAPAIDLVGLFIRYPEVEEACNPNLLVRAEDKRQQEALFDAAEKKIEERRAEDPAAADAALSVLKKLKKIQRPFLVADPVRTSEVMERYSEVLQRIFGEDAPNAAKDFATLFLNFPALEGELSPMALAKLEPAKASQYFRRQWMGKVHPDRSRFNEQDIATEAMKLVSALQVRYESQEAVKQRAENGWTTAEAIETGRPTWQLRVDQAYEGGRNGGSNLRMPHRTVSNRHFRLYANVGRWILEHVGQTYPTFVNGHEIRRQELKNGDRIQVGYYQVQFFLHPDGSASLREATEQVPSTPPPPAISADPRSGALTLQFKPGLPVLLGRDQIPDARVSPQHVELIHNSRTWLIRDMGSELGTQVNGVDIQSAMDPTSQRRTIGTFRELKHGSLVTIGGLTFRFQESPDRSAAFVQVAGEVAPPSAAAAHMRTPPPQVFRLPLQEGHNYPFQSPRGQEVAEIFWDGYDNGGGEFVIREITNAGQVWILDGNTEQPLRGQAYALSDGVIFGLGPKPEESQWYLFKDGHVTALQRPARVRAATEPMDSPPGPRIKIPPTAQSMSLGRGDLGGSNNISGKHFEVWFRNNLWLIRDVGSQNGTYLNQRNIGKGKGQAGDWHPLNGNDVLMVGGLEFHVSLAMDGSLNLEPVQSQRPPERVSPIPASPFPFAKAPSYGPPKLEGDKLNMGWIRTLKIVESDRDPGLYPEVEASPESGKYHLVIRKKEGFLGRAGAILGFSGKEFASVEYLSEGRFKVTNQALKNGIRIWNDTGKDITVREGGNSDYANVGDKLTINGQTLVLRP